MQILLLEDEAPAARRLERLLGTVAPQAQVAGMAASVSEAIDWLDNNPVPDLILADIELCDGRCFDLFRERPPQGPVIFTTAYDAFALQAFENNGVAYLLKPIEEAHLRKAFDKLTLLKGNTDDLLAAQQRALTQLLQQMAPTVQPGKNYRERFLLKFGERYVPLEMKEVAFFAASDKLVFAVTHEGRRLPLDDTLDELEGDLDPSTFFRINRSVIASRPSIRQIAAHFNGRLKLGLHPDPQQEVFVSRERAAVFRAWMNR